MLNPPAATLSAETATPLAGPPTVQHFRQALLWPVRLMPAPGTTAAHHGPWHVLRDMGEASPWREEVDDYTGDSSRFHERHYNEFVSFLPYVQRFLYGEGRSRGAGATDGDSPMRIFRRHDIAAVRVVAQPGEAPVTLDVIHCDLYFFFDIDVVLLNLEVGADHLSLAQAQDILYRFGRAYPSGWEADGSALHCMASVEWLDGNGRVLASSDAQQREAFLSHVAQHRAPRISSHWAYLMQPLVSDHSEDPGVLRYRQIEYYRMPVMAYLSLDDPRRLTRDDFVRLALVTGAGAPMPTCPTPRTTWRTSSTSTATTASGSTPARRRTRATCATATRSSWWATRIPNSSAAATAACSRSSGTSTSCCSSSRISRRRRC